MSDITQTLSSTSSDSNSADPTSQPSANTTDDATKKRFSDLSIVGNFLYQVSNDNAEQTDYFLAKTALQEFDQAVKSIDLDLKTRSGMNNLIKYLDTKIEKRNRQAGGEFSKD